tara:strand:+ start:53 stop:1126 length:1074 start_codon:yes stop_codon:yes gene_type:complete
MDCTQITPISAFVSSNLNSKIDSFSRLGDRITRALGAPMVNVEIHHDQLFENISIACELFTKFAGYTDEYLVFDSNLYTPKKGLKLDDLFSISPEFNRINKPISTVYVSISSLPNTVFSTSTILSATYADGIFKNQILTNTNYLSVVNFNAALSASFNPSVNSQESFDNSFDYDVMNYRKVIDVVDFEEGSSTGVNTLFTIEQTLAQQTYFSYSMGNYGFDLISWYVLKDWLKNREKMLAQKRSYTFNDRTQYLTMTPSPGTPSSSHFYGVVSCYVERPLRDIIKEQWVYQYALALSKISVGNVRGKYSGTTLFGGGSINIDMLAQGLSEKEKLEERLYTGATPGLGDAAPPMFFVG